MELPGKADFYFLRPAAPWLGWARDGEGFALLSEEFSCEISNFEGEWNGRRGFFLFALSAGGFRAGNAPGKGERGQQKAPGGSASPPRHEPRLMQPLLKSIQAEASQL